MGLASAQREVEELKTQLAMQMGVIPVLKDTLELTRHCQGKKMEELKRRNYS